MTCVWVYDTAPNGIGKVASAGITAEASAGYQRSFAYDDLTRPVQATVTAGGRAYTFAASYDVNSRLSGVTYPSGLVLNYTYTSLGYALGIVDPAIEVHEADVGKLLRRENSLRSVASIRGRGRPIGLGREVRATGTLSFESHQAPKRRVERLTPWGLH